MIRDIKSNPPRDCCPNAYHLFKTGILRPAFEYVIATRTHETVVFLFANNSTWRISFCPFCGEIFSWDDRPKLAEIDLPR